MLLLINNYLSYSEKPSSTTKFCPFIEFEESDNRNNKAPINPKHSTYLLKDYSFYMQPGMTQVDCLICLQEKSS